MFYLEVDQPRCERNRMCVRLAPELFTQTGDGPAQASPAPLGEEQIEIAEEAELICPARAIAVTER
jgi:ferredoxin